MDRYIIWLWAEYGMLSIILLLILFTLVLVILKIFLARAENR
ncbi:MAG: hypothetical protein WDA53_01800 [Bacillota bacterium]